MPKAIRRINEPENYAKKKRKKNCEKFLHLSVKSLESSFLNDKIVNLQLLKTAF